MEVKINNESLKDIELRQMIDYLAEAITEKHHKKMMKRNVVIRMVEFTWKMFIVVLTLKFFPELFSSLFANLGTSL